jgi:hypothetical protein
MNTHIDLKQKIYLSLQNLKNGLFEFLFRPPSKKLASKTGGYLVLGMTYLVGVFHWGWLLNYGRLHYKYMDWQKFFDYYGIIQKALIENTIPYFMPYFYKGTNQFLALPETDLSPTIILLKFLSVEDFFLTQFLIVYSVGFIGCLWLRKTYQWSLFTFVFLFLVFNLNGHIVSHLAFGHWPWISYFLFPFFIGWVFKLVEGDVSPLHGTRLSWVLFAMLLLGGLHPFVWCLIFLFILCVSRKRYWKPVSIGVALAMVFSSYRIIPAAVTFFGYENYFSSGFPSLFFYWEALTYVNGQENMLTFNFVKENTAPWWEVDHYIGIIGLAAIMFFGIFLRLKKKSEWGVNDYRVLNIPMLVLAVLSFGSIYKWFTLIPLPLISVERVSARFLIVPLLFLLVISCIWMQQTFNRLSARWSVMLLALAGLLVEGFLFFEHSAIWHVKVWEATLSVIKINIHDPYSDWAKSVEGYYIPIVQISYLISLIALLAFVAGSIYFNRKARGKEA